jgi:ADP-heptose:LPS heptosyltransferase
LGFAVAVGVWADARAAVLIAETGAGKRIGFPMTAGNYYGAKIPWRRRRLLAGGVLEHFWRLIHPGKVLLTACLHRTDMKQPHARCWEQIAEALGVTCDYSTPWIHIPEPSRKVADFESAARAAGKEVLIVQANAHLPSKQWPREMWLVLLRSPEVLSRFRVLELLPPKTDPLDPEIHSATTESTAELAGALSVADVVVCHDSFPAHLAAALGKPVVTIFGSGEPDWFAPWQNRARAVNRQACPLHPCIDRCCMDSYLCLDAVTVKDVSMMITQIPATR